MPAIHFTATTALFSGVISISALLAAVVPHWFYLEPTSVRYGPGVSCIGNTCQTNPYFTTRTVGSCTLNGSEWKDRDSASVAFAVIAIVLLAALATVVWLAWFRCHELIGSLKLAVLMAIAFGAGVCFLVSISIFASTFSQWINCGRPFCELFPSPLECGYGASFVCIIVSLILCAFIFFAILALACFETRVAEHRGGITFWLGITIVIAIALGVVGAASSRWMVVSSSPLSMGLFSQCQSGKCQDNQYPAQVAVTGTCVQPGNAKADRDRAVGALLILSFIGSGVLCVAYALKFFGVIRIFFDTKLRVIALCLYGFLLFLLCLALIIFGATYNSWLTCGQDFCSVFGGAGAINCNYGFSFAAALVALLMTIVVIVLLLLELFRCCNLCGRLEYYSSDPMPGDAMAAASSPTAYSSSSTYHSSTRTTTIATTGRMPPGDWVWDKEMGYYWSESRQLYYDEPTHQIFNPASGQWTPA